MAGVSRRWVEREAAGVVAGIVAYNYPMQLSLVKLAPALAAGCTVVLQGAPQAPLLAAALGQLPRNGPANPAGAVNALASARSDKPRAGHGCVSPWQS